MSEKKEKCMIFALAGILLLIVCLPVKEKEKNKNNDSFFISQSDETSKKSTVSRNQEDGGKKMGESDDVRLMEQELKELLQCMDGAGRVEVMITLKATREEIVEKDRPAKRSNITEQDGTGGSRSTNDMDHEEETVYVTDAEGNKIPYVRKTLQPVVEGVAVLAQGGDNESVKQNIRETIQALFGIDANKIKIAKMKTGK